MSKRPRGNRGLFCDKLSDMGLYLRQNEPRSQVQTKVAADLAERLNKHAGDDANLGRTSQPAILDNQRKTSPMAWVWLLLAVVAVGSLLYVLAR